MSRTVTTWIAAGAFALALGCTHEPWLHETHGKATEANAERMSANPGAGHQTPHEGLDPRTAEHVLENYSKGQAAQEHNRSSRPETGVFLGDIGSN